MGESSDWLAAMVTMISRLPIIVTMQMSKNGTIRTFCISEFSVSPRRTNSVTLSLFSMCSEAVDQVSETENQWPVKNLKSQALCQICDALLNSFIHNMSHKVSLQNMTLCSVLPQYSIHFIKFLASTTVMKLQCSNLGVYMSGCIYEFTYQMRKKMLSPEYLLSKTRFSFSIYILFLFP